MSVLPRSRFWERVDVTGCEHVTFDDRRGLTARGVQIAVNPVPYACRYALFTDADWVTARFEATTEGAGWLRTIRIERAAKRWRVTTAEQGDLDAAVRTSGQSAQPFPGSEDPDRLVDAFDLDLAGSPLTNTLPIRRLGLHTAPTGRRHTITAAWVLLPSLAVVPSEQEYTVLDGGRIRYSSGEFSSDLEIDESGFVVNYPQLARQSKPA
jgi:hypothetical protein